MLLGWGGAQFSASVLAECQRPKLYAFPSRLRKQPSRGFCPCIIQEAPALETANTDFPSPGGSLSQATTVSDGSAACVEQNGSDPCPGDTCQAFLTEEASRGHAVKNLSGFGLHPKVFIPLSLCPFQEHRSAKQRATCSAGVWCSASHRLQGHLAAWRRQLEHPETLKQPA